MPEHPPVLSFEKINKTYPGVNALKDVSFDVQQGEVHCLVGENGAGKSTLIKILAGAQQADSGRILLAGKPVVSRSPHEAQEHGLS